MYHRGTLEQFNTWHETVKISEGLPKVGCVNGIPAPTNQRTTAYAEAIKNPNGNNDYVWEYGKYKSNDYPVLTFNDYQLLNW